MVTQRLATPGSTSSPSDDAVVVPAAGGSIDTIRGEIDDAFKDMRTFKDLDPDEVMRIVAGWSARFSELRVRAMRIEDVAQYRRFKTLRTRDLEPIMDELKQQFMIASRLQSVRELDYKIEAGER